jgi:DNA repair protein RadD
MPTGAGKTHTFCQIAQLAADRGHETLILAHRRELLAQISARLHDMGVSHGLSAPGHSHTSSMIQVGAIHSAPARLQKADWAPKLVIIDEAHHAAARGWQRVLDSYSSARIVGWTATPARLDGKGLSDIFDTLLLGPSTRELIESGYLSRYRLYAPPSRIDRAALSKRAGEYKREDAESSSSQPVVLAAAVKNYKQYAGGRQTIAFCTTVRHAQLVCQAFVDAGIAAISIDGSLAAAERQRRLDLFRTRQVRILVSVDLISEGFDVPGCECVLLLRPTASLSIYLQQVGRALRPSASEAVILDCAGNSLEHGLPCQDRAWSLEGSAQDREMGQQAVPINVCEACYAVYKPASACPYCGHTPAAKKTPPIEQDMLLDLVDPEMIAKQRRQEIGRARTLQELLVVAKQRGYKPGWAHQVFRNRR